MKYVARGEQELLPWLRSGLPRATRFLAACPCDDDGMALLEPELSAFMERGGYLNVVSPVIPDLLLRLGDRFPGRVTAVVSHELPDCRLGLTRADGSCEAFVGAAALTGAGLMGEASGLLLAGRRDGAEASRVVKSIPPADERHGPRFLYLEDLMQPVMDGLERVGGRRHPVGERLWTGFHDLDRLTGGRNAGQLWLVNGASGVGKSVLALNFARSCSIAHGAEVLWLCTRDPATALVERLLSAEARVPRHHMWTGEMTDDDWARLARRMGEIVEAPFSIAEIPRTADVATAALDALSTRPTARLLLVDSLESGRDLATLASLRELAARTETWIVAIAPYVTDGSQVEIEELQAKHADLVLRLYREDQWNKDTPRAGEADLIVSRYRTGPTATITVHFQGHYSRFADPTKAS